MLQGAKAAVTMLASMAMLCASTIVPAQSGPLMLIEAASGKVLYADDQDDQWYPASLTKIMTAYIVFEELKAGRLKPTDMVRVSERAHKEPPSKLGLPVGGEITVDLAIRVLIVKSANDVAVMLAEKVGGSVEGFAKRMNETARRLGMTSTHFVNPNGLPDPGQVTSARDLARLSRAMMTRFPEHRDLWAVKEIAIGKKRLRSHNGLLKKFEGADGIKTGFICDSGFNIVASATRDGRQLIAIILGEPSGKDRTIRAASLLEHGFSTSPWKLLFGVPTVDSLPRDPAAKPAASIRKSVTAWNCNNHKPARRMVRRKGKHKASPVAKAKPAKSSRASTRSAKAAAARKAPAITGSTNKSKTVKKTEKSRSVSKTVPPPRSAEAKQ
ncbi:MAG: D-alanyl-D-alanine carboxypeptidase family protein [Hyphomicrobiaceae bacterium]